MKTEHWTTAARRLAEPLDLLSLAMYLAWDLGTTDDFQLPKFLRRQRKSDPHFLTPGVQVVVDLYRGDGRYSPPRSEVRGVAKWAYDNWALNVLQAAVPQEIRVGVDHQNEKGAA